MITVKQSMATTGEAHRRVEARKVHFMETAAGILLG
jgi:hypothetical protein